MRVFLRFLGWVIIAFITTQCAQISNPSGGPKDTSPPEILGASPLNGSANFDGEKFTIYFDEFIELDNIVQKAMISPPTDKLPDFKVKGKSLQVKFEEELKANTTYSVYFGDAIVDITERNPVLNFTYIFSTGPTVDSMSIFGNVLNSFDLTPAEEVFVLLYKDNNDTLELDSLPLAVKPFYLSKTDVNGAFQLNGLSNESYMMFAIKDLNGNYYYDQPGEEIAFIDSLVSPLHLNPPVLDSTVFDTLDFESPYFDSLQYVIDSIFRDSLAGFEKGMIMHTLLLFDEVDTTMQLLKAETTDKNIFRFSFSMPADDVVFEILNYSSDTIWYLEDFSRDKDTITWYLRDIPTDTVEMLILYEEDTLGLEYMRPNPTRKLPGFGRKKKKDEEVKKEYLTFSTNTRGGKLRLDRLPEITFSHPLQETITDSIMLVIAEDSTYNPEFIFIDSLHRQIQFPIDIIEETKYEIKLPDSSFIDWNGLHNKGLSVRFSTKSLRDYGVLELNLRPEVQQAYILQLMTENESVVRELYFYGDTTLILHHLDPAEYKLKVIFDDNGNRKWDSGYYSSKLQPEKVLYFPKNAMIRGNWELEEDWRIAR